MQSMLCTYDIGGFLVSYVLTEKMKTIFHSAKPL
jgi:hypothetical protein